MRRISCVVILALLAVLAVAGGASGSNSNPSCNGILVSSLAGQPGVVGELTRAFHQEFKDAGIPPGFFDVAGAKEHAGGVEACLTP
jgi:hypothetical protein